MTGRSSAWGRSERGTRGAGWPAISMRLLAPPIGWGRRCAGAPGATISSEPIQQSPNEGQRRPRRVQKPALHLLQSGFNYWWVFRGLTAGPTSPGGPICPGSGLHAKVCHQKWNANQKNKWRLFFGGKFWCLRILLISKIKKCILENKIFIMNFGF